MSTNWFNNTNTTVQAYRLRDDVCVRGAVELGSSPVANGTAAMGTTKQVKFIAHAYGGSGG